MPSRALFPTLFYEGELGDPALIAELNDAARELAIEDRAGRAWAWFAPALPDARC